VTLQGSEAIAIKKALSNNEIPSGDLLNALLYKAGILNKAVCLETSLSVKTSLVKTEEITVARDGQVLDERCFETKEDNYYTSASSEIWKPVVLPRPDLTRMREKLIASAKSLYIVAPPNDDVFSQSSTSNKSSASSVSPMCKIPTIPVSSQRQQGGQHTSRFPTESSNGSVGSYSSSSDGSSTTSSRPTSNVSIIDSNTATNCTVTFPDDDDDHVYDNVRITSMPKPPNSRAKNNNQYTKGDANTVTNSSSWDSGHPMCTGDYEDMSRLQTTASISSSFGDYSTASGTSTLDETDFVHTGDNGLKKVSSAKSPVYMLRKPQTHMV
jgi:hypothetical protein